MLLLVGSSWALARPLDHAQLQFAGEMGAFSLGLGKQISERYSLGAMYGVVPQGYEDSDERIDTVGVRQTWRLWHQERLTAYAGFLIYHVLGIRYETSRYKDLPEGYYPIGSVRALPSLGMSLSVDAKRRERMYFEVGVNDLWIANALANRDPALVMDNLSLALGRSWQF